jgi:PleD family two-component response regulator
MVLTQVDLFRAADQGMYRAKQAGRNQVVAAGEINAKQAAA